MGIENFYLKHKDKLIGYACAFCHDYDMAEDVVQESFIKALVKDDTFKDRSEPELLSWFYVVIKNHLVDHSRKKWRNQPYVDYIHDAKVKVDLGSDLEFRQMVKSLPDQLAASVWLRYGLGYNSKEIGEKLGINDATIRSRLKKARELLKKDYVN